MHRAIAILIKALNIDISPAIYLAMGVSLFIGFCFCTGLFISFDQSVLYSSGVVVNRNIWGGVLFLTSSIATIGFIRKNYKWISFGGMFGFMTWLFACLALLLAGHVYVFFSVGFFHLAFHVYIFLAGSLKTLERVKPVDLVT